ncbi:MAG: ISChy1, transposase [Clostridia bacterium 41_269]|nr:MAG: ISChy1, transposase [Clostridia bacterium 41_269]
MAQYAGLTWSRYQSGDFDTEERRLTKTGNRYLRYYLVEAANSLQVHNEEYKAYYHAKYKEVAKHQHKRALVLTARKFVLPC